MRAILLILVFMFSCTTEAIADDIRKAKPGFIYIINNPDSFCNDEMVIKIGLTTQKTPSNRVRTLNTSVPFDFTILGWIYTDDVYDTEDALHDHFWRERMDSGSEFFYLTFEEVVKYAEELGFEVKLNYYDFEQYETFKNN